MTRFDPDTLEGALEAARYDKQSGWIQSHLALPYNRNDELAQGLLSVSTRAYLGPIRVPLTDLLRVCGPEKDMPFPEEETVWNKRIEALLSKLKAGWTPPPFIVAGGSKKPFYLADGNHRLVALQYFGVNECWAIFFFDDNVAKRTFEQHFSYSSQ